MPSSPSVHFLLLRRACQREFWTELRILRPYSKVFSQILGESVPFCLSVCLEALAAPALHPFFVPPVRPG